jgi:hypothetical protein
LGKNVNAEIRKAKSEILKEFEVLDMTYEVGDLLPGEKERMDIIISELENLEYGRNQG